MEQVQYYGTGRRKTSTARVRLVPGTGVVTVNNRDASDYFPYETQLLLLNQPLVSTETQGTYDVLVNVDGGGFTGQAERFVMVLLVHYLKQIQSIAQHLRVKAS